MRLRTNRQVGIWRERFRISRTGAILLSLFALVWLNGVTSGTGEHCGWSLFGVWADEIGYIRGSSTPLYDTWYLLTGGGSRMLWLYTWLHVVPAAILGWAAAGVFAAILMLIRRRGSRHDAPGLNSGQRRL